MEYDITSCPSLSFLLFWAAISRVTHRSTDISLSDFDASASHPNFSCSLLTHSVATCPGQVFLLNPESLVPREATGKSSAVYCAVHAWPGTPRHSTPPLRSTTFDLLILACTPTYHDVCLITTYL